MTKLGIIGYGTIASTYIKSLSYMRDSYELCGIYDIDCAKAERDLANQFTIYDSLEVMLQTDIECVIISTPIHTHFDIASKCLEAKKHVIMEKPATLSLFELEQLFAIARDNKVIFYVAFHSSFAKDIEWYLGNQETIDSCYGVDEIIELECGFYDPYMKNGKIFDNRISLCGSYIDSGVNILSVCNRLVSLEHYKIHTHTSKADENDVVFSSDTTYTDGNKKIIMHTGWDKNLNQKRTLLTFKNTENRILLDHSNQCVKLLADSKETILYQDNEQERLVNHYIGVFQSFLNCLDWVQHEKCVMKIHELLLNALNIH